jgi:hypothetical protein
MDKQLDLNIDKNLQITTKTTAATVTCEAAATAVTFSLLLSSGLPVDSSAVAETYCVINMQHNTAAANQNENNNLLDAIRSKRQKNFFFKTRAN